MTNKKDDNQNSSSTEEKKDLPQNKEVKNHSTVFNYVPKTTITFSPPVVDIKDKNPQEEIPQSKAINTLNESNTIPTKDLLDSPVAQEDISPENAVTLVTNNAPKVENKEIIPKEIISSNNVTTTTTPLAKIPVKQIEVDKDQLIVNQPEGLLPEELQEQDTKKSFFFFRRKSSKTNLDKNAYEERVNKVISSVASLFAPFKEIIVKTLPFTKGIIKFLDKIGQLIAAIAKFIAMRMPALINFVKSSYFKIIIAVVVILFIGGALISRSVNTQTYIGFLEKSIYKYTGYNATIDGVIKVNFLPSLAISLNKVNLYSTEEVPLQKNKFNVSNLNADIIVVKFKFLPLFLGRFVVKDLWLSQANIDIKGSEDYSATSSEDINFSNIIKNIEQSIATKVNDSLVQEIKQREKQVPNNSSKEDALIKDVKTLIQEDKSQADDKTQEKSFIENLQNGVDAQDFSSQKVPSNNSNYQLNPTVQTLPNLNQRVEDNPKGLVYKIASYFVRNFYFSYKATDSIKLSRGQLNVLSSDNKRILVLDNIKADFKTKFNGDVASEGSFRFINTNMDYNLITKFNKEGYSYNASVSFGNDDKTVVFNGAKKYNSDVTFGHVTADGEGLPLFINNFLFKLKSTTLKDANFSATYQLSSNKLKIDNINFKVNKDQYAGNLLWNFSPQKNFLNVDIKLVSPDVSYILNSYLGSLNNTAVKGAKFLSFVELTNNWKNNTINNFGVSNIRFKISTTNTTLNNQKVQDLNLAFITNSYNKFYIEDLNIDTGTSSLKLTGELDLDSKNGLLALQTKGNVTNTGDLWKLPDNSIKFLNLVGEGKTDYNLSGKIILDNARVVVNDIKGNIGNKIIDNTYALFFQRVDSSDLVITSKLDNINGEYLSTLYKNQLAELKENPDKSINVFGISPNLAIKLNLYAAKFTYKNLNFNNANLEIDLINSGFLLRNFEAQGELGGSVVGSFNVDTSVNPIVAGHLNFDNYVFSLENTSQLAFSKYDLIGNVMLSGKVRFSGSNFMEPFEKVDGEVTFIKYERILLNRFANTAGLYMTLTEEKTKGKSRFLINDLYGKVNIVDSKVNFYPVAFLYILDKVEHRGVFEANYDFVKDNLTASGAVDNTVNINKQIQFNVNGSLLNPTVVKKDITLKRNISGKATYTVDDTIKSTQKTHKVFNNLNNSKDPNNFNNTYNFNMNERDKVLKEKNYNRDIEDLNKHGKYDFNKSYGDTSMDKVKEKNTEDYQKSLDDLQDNLKDNAHKDDFKKYYNPKKQQLDLNNTKGQNTAK